MVLLISIKDFFQFNSVGSVHGSLQKYSSTWKNFCICNMLYVSYKIFWNFVGTIMVKFETNLDMYIKVTKYLLQI